MFNTLYSKLSAVLFGLVFVIGLLFFQLVSYSTEMYQHEATQKLNITLADHIVEDLTLLNNGEVNRGALKELFHMMMVINPNIEIRNFISTYYLYIIFRRLQRVFYNFL